MYSWHFDATFGYNLMTRRKKVEYPYEYQI